MLEEEKMGTAARTEAVMITRQRLESMQEFMEVTNKVFHAFISGSKSGLQKVVKVLLKAL